MRRWSAPSPRRAAAPCRLTAPSSTGVAGLTTRERTVIRYLPTRLSNREIASDLCVSMNTLKTHLQSTYRKLGVESGAAAVERARHFGLLWPHRASC